MAWSRLLFHSARHIGNCRKQGILRQVLRQRAVVFPYRRQIQFVEKKDVPSFLRSKYFRYGFLIFFLAMFFVMIFNTYLVFSGAGTLSEKVTLLWTFKLPWDWAYGGGFIPWTAQFAFGFYSIMLTSTILGFITMLLFKPRSWCVYCPMGTMTQLICKVKNK